MLCILRHRGVQLILAYNWTRPASLVAGNGRGIFFISSVPLLSVELSVLRGSVVRRCCVSYVTGASN